MSDDPEILTLGDSRLRRDAVPVESFGETVARFVETMWSVLRETGGLGLAAPQLGVGWRLFVMDDGDGTARTVINPRVVEWSGSRLSLEGCLSVPRMVARVPRFDHVTVEAQDVLGQDVTIDAVGLASSIVQHEIDHLDGRFYFDRLSLGERDRFLRRWKRLLRRR